jgi:hypothetical protein
MSLYRGIYLVHVMGISCDVSLGSKHRFLHVGHSKHFPNSVSAMVVISFSQFGQTITVTIFSICIPAPLNLSNGEKLFIKTSVMLMYISNICLNFFLLIYPETEKKD